MGNEFGEGAKAELFNAETSLIVFISKRCFCCTKTQLAFSPVGRKRLLQRIMVREETKIRHRGGRPTKQVKRDIIKGIRFTKVEYYVVKQKASKSGNGITDYIRQMALHGKIISRLNEEERQFVRQLIGVANNINQLTKKGHQEGFLTAVLMFEKYRKLIDNLLEKLKP